MPGQGVGLVWSPIGFLPAAHAKGLGCLMTTDNPSAVVFLAPPYFTGCVHGLP